MCLAQGPQRSEARTHGPSVLSQALYHWATALPEACLRMLYLSHILTWNLLMNCIIDQIKMLHSPMKVCYLVKTEWIQLSQNILGSCLFVWYDSLRPINNLSVIKGQVFWGWTSTKLGLMCFDPGHKAVTPVRLKPTAPRSRVRKLSD